jgi:hypothetical protein
LHALEDDQPVAGGLDPIVEDAELGAKTQFVNFRLDEPLGGLRQGALNLTDAHAEGSALQHAALDYELGKEV